MRSSRAVPPPCTVASRRPASPSPTRRHLRLRRSPRGLDAALILEIARGQWIPEHECPPRRGRLGGVRRISRSRSASKTRAGTATSPSGARRFRPHPARGPRHARADPPPASAPAPGSAPRRRGSVLCRSTSPGGELLFNLLAASYEKRGMLVTTNLPFSAAARACAVAAAARAQLPEAGLLRRLRNHCVRVIGRTSAATRRCSIGGW